MIRIVSARPLEGFRLDLAFSDGVRGVVDLSGLAGRGVFAAWNLPGAFERVFVDPVARTVAWPGGIDLDPDVLYEQARGGSLNDLAA
ncbi:MAG: DUF2442 domain-containing protein [Planctomycetes bacterium]|nr:DUF2442 domain-containing protein [Planctomycetota bacterium]